MIFKYTNNVYNITKSADTEALDKNWRSDIHTRDEALQYAAIDVILSFIVAIKSDFITHDAYSYKTLPINFSTPYSFTKTTNMDLLYTAYALYTKVYPLLTYIYKVDPSLIPPTFGDVIEFLRDSNSGKEPGIHDYPLGFYGCVDLMSLYPSITMACNLSHGTIFPSIDAIADYFDGDCIIYYNPYSKLNKDDIGTLTPAHPQGNTARERLTAQSPREVYTYGSGSTKLVEGEDFISLGYFYVISAKHKLAPPAEFIKDMVGRRKAEMKKISSKSSSEYSKLNFGQGTIKLWINSAYGLLVERDKNMSAEDTYKKIMSPTPTVKALEYPMW